MGWPIEGEDSTGAAFAEEPQQNDDQQKHISEYYYDLEGAVFSHYGMTDNASPITSSYRRMIGPLSICCS